MVKEKQLPLQGSILSQCEQGSPQLFGLQCLCSYGGQWLQSVGLQSSVFLSFNQSARNYSCRRLISFLEINRKELNSSETRRKVSTILNNYDPHFLSWFVGFVEGDGSFNFDPKATRFSLQIRQKDSTVLYYIKDTLGFGNVYLMQDGYYTYNVSNHEDIEILISIFNGQLILNKTNKRFYDLWLLNFNKNFPNKFINFLGNGSFEGFNNAWLCGFTDAEGSFGVKLNEEKTGEGKTRLRLRTYWYIDQSFEKPVFEQIKTVLGFGRIEKKISGEGGFSNKGDAWRLIVDSFKNTKVMLEYFDKYPPRSTKICTRFNNLKQILYWINNDNWRNHIPEIEEIIKLNQEFK